MNYQEAINRRRVAIELFEETIEIVKKDGYNELILLDIRYGRGYPTIENLEEAIKNCNEEIQEYREMLHNKQFQTLIDERISKNRLKSLLGE